MPEASVIRDPQVLSGFIGRKASVGGQISLWLKPHGSTMGMPERLFD